MIGASYSPEGSTFNLADSNLTDSISSILVDPSMTVLYVGTKGKIIKYSLADFSDEFNYY